MFIAKYKFWLSYEIMTISSLNNCDLKLLADTTKQKFSMSEQSNKVWKSILEKIQYQKYSELFPFITFLF